MDFQIEEIRRPISLKDEAYQRIKQLILSGTLDSGDMLDIDRLASGLGISRTPLREALLRLEQDGLVKTIPYKGTFVAEVFKKDVEEIYQVREVLESLAVRLATSAIPDDELGEMQALFASVEAEIAEGNFELYAQSDTQFHDLITRHCGNEVLQQLLKTLADRVHRVRIFSRKQAGPHIDRSFQEHGLVLNALLERDVDSASDLMAEHLRNAGRRIADLVQEE
jgi:DNA-binding GntR family transcriptional regulator